MVTNIVYLINSLGVGGAEVGMCRLLNGLDKDQYNVTVVVLDGRNTSVEDQIPQWARTRYLYSSDGGHLLSKYQIIKSIYAADIIVGSLFHSVMVAKLAGLINRNATVATWRHVTPFKNKKRKFLFDWTSSLTDVVLSDSEAVAQTLVNNTRIDESLVFTVPIAGIEISKYTPVTHKPTGTPVVGTVGRLTEQKNHTTILDVAKQFQETGVSFEIAGEGNLYDELEGRITEQGLSNVTLRGFVDDIPDFLSDLDIYFQPSLHEGLCITVLEAMATGLPVVGSNVGGIGRNVKHGKNGFLYEPYNIEGFISGIQGLSADVGIRQELGRQARETVKNRFTQRVLVSKFKSAIKKHGQK